MFFFQQSFMLEPHSTYFKGLTVYIKYKSVNFWILQCKLCLNIKILNKFLYFKTNSDKTVTIRNINGYHWVWIKIYTINQITDFSLYSKICLTDCEWSHFLTSCNCCNGHFAYFLHSVRHRD